jgi:hypothetical protein
LVRIGAGHFRDGGHRVKYDAAADAMRALRHRVWIAMPPEQGVVVVHDVYCEDGL